MNSEEILFKQYKLYTEQKDAFIERSFRTNKFYLISVIVLTFLMYILKGATFEFGLNSTLIFSVAGLAICTLWWSNMDAYNLIIKVKLSKVIEKIEEQLPFQPYKEEFIAIKDLRKNKKMFLFSDMQKSFAILAFLMFLVLLINEVVPFFFAID